jgi:geranylgeranyl pyrophosphate synthase
MNYSLQEFMTGHRQAVENALDEYLPVSSQRATDRLNEAVRYAVFPGGKRWRPMFTLLAAQLVGGSAQQAMPAACAVEFLHTSSLILDDLPSMDDADLRRGRPALHLQFGEGIAVLASLALLNQAYALLACVRCDRKSYVADLICEATRCIGSEGMIGGQAADLEMRSSVVNAEALASRNLKTTALTRLMMTCGAMAVGANEGDVAALAQFGESLGAAYQVYDDLLDEIGERETLGKTIRQDERHLLPGFVAELGVEGAYRLTMSLLAEGRSALTERFGETEEVKMLHTAADCLLGGAGSAKIPTTLVSSGD